MLFNEKVMQKLMEDIITYCQVNIILHICTLSLSLGNKIIAAETLSVWRALDVRCSISGVSWLCVAYLVPPYLVGLIPFGSHYNSLLHLTFFNGKHFKVITLVNTSWLNDMNDG